jgi:biotin carboxyl carrier protein
VLTVAVAEGEAVERGQVICIVEAMKMENEVRAPHGGTVEQLSVQDGGPVGAGQVICVLA